MRRLVVGLLLITARAALSQPAPVPTSEAIHIEWIDFEEGLPSYTIYQILEDRRGYLWMGTAIGLVRYDGYAFQTFPANSFDAHALPRDDTIALAESRDGSLWVGTKSNGLFRYDSATEVSLRIETPPGASLIASLLETHDGMLWVGTWNGGLFQRTVDGVWEQMVHDPSDDATLSSNQTRAIFEDSRGTVWVGSVNGLNRLEPGESHFRRLLHFPDMPAFVDYNMTDPSSYPPTEIREILEAADGTIWVGSAFGLHQFSGDGELIQTYRHDADDPATLRHDWVHTLEQAPDGTIWIGTLKGLDSLDPASGVVTRRQYESPDVGVYQYYQDFVTDLHLDGAGLLWIGTAYFLGKHDSHSTRFEFISLPDGDIGRSLVEAPGGTLLVGTEAGILYRYDPRTDRVDPVERFAAIAPATEWGGIETLFIDAVSRLWVGTSSGGIVVLPPDSRSYFRLTADPGDPTSIPPGPVRAILENSPGRYWIGGGGGLKDFEFDSQFAVTHAGDLFDSLDVTDLGEGRDGALWVSTYSGVAKVDPQTRDVRRYAYDPADSTSIGHPFTYQLQIESDGSVWVATFGSLDRYDPSGDAFIHHRSPSDANLSATICVQALDDVWAMTFRGVARMNRRTGAIVYFGAERGLDSAVFANGGTCAARSDGLLTVAGNGGFYRVDTRSFSDNPFPPRVAIEAVTVDADRLSRAEWEARAPRLHHHENQIEFALTAIHGTAPEKNHYEYRLDDSKWTDLGAGRTVRIAGLPPGDHTFEARAASAAGVWSDPVAASFHIRPPWWASAWAYLFYLIGILVAVFAAHEARVITIKRRADELKVEVAARTCELESEKQKTDDQARRLVRLDEAKNRFFANISHEFRTPLTLILGPLEDALSGRYGKLDGGLHSQLSLMERSGRGLLRLINQLLDLSRLESGTMRLDRRTMDLSAILAEVGRGFVPMAERLETELTVKVPTAAVPVMLDPGAIEQVFSNLIANALNHTPVSGRVAVALLGEKEAIVTVSDTGPGIAGEDLERIFERFQQGSVTVRRNQNGSGLGLALSRELVELHDGTITVDSDLGRGTTFTVTLPLSRMPIFPGTEGDGFEGDPPLPALEGLPLAELEAEAEDAQGACVLVAEDNDDVRLYLRQHLEDCYQVIEARNGETALELALEHHPDLVLSDVMMPRMDGFELCRRIKSDNSLGNTPVVLLTAKAAEDDTIEGLEGGADAYVAKPFSMPALQLRIANLIASRIHMRETFGREVMLRPANIEIEPEEAAFLETVLSHINDHLSDANLSIEWLADELCLSRRQLERRINALTNMTPARLVRQIRMERASQLLQSHSGNVADVARAVGYRDPSHFSRVFLKVYGERPTEHEGEQA